MKKWFWYPIANIKNRFLFGAYGKDIYIEPGVVINRPRYVHVGDHVRIKRNTSINLHPKDRKSKEPLLFIKPSTSVIGPGEAIIYPKMSKRVDYEAELAVVIGKAAKGVSEERATEYILGYTCLNDVTARDLQPKDGQWTTAKGFDTFAPIGPWIVTDIDPHRLDVSSYLNGERRQHSNTKNLIFGPRQLVSFISQVMTLLPGDVIATGTPSGIGPMDVGDKIDVVIEGIGTLSNNLVAEK